MYQEEILKYYSRPDVKKAIVSVAENRELVPTLPSGGFGKRPNVVYYERDVEEMVKQRAVSFHGSVERWSNPLALRTEMRKDELDELRTGWDLVIDIDCDKGLEYSKRVALALCDALEKFGVKDYGIKYSGNRGFHIGLPFEAFPESVYGFGTLDKQFPRVPKIIIEYLSYFIEKDIRAAFPGEDIKDILKLDAAVAASRHLFRMPYCLHQKTWLVSVPIEKSEIKGFKKEDALPGKVKADKPFFKPGVEENEAVELLQAAIFWDSRRQAGKKEVDVGSFQLPRNAIEPKYFPPCIKNIVAGIEDGKKRSVFVLITFLHNIGWKRDDILRFLLEWNKKNKPPLRGGFIQSALASQYSRAAPQMAPNCKNPGYYEDFGVCTPDEFCRVIKNPVTYTLARVKSIKKRKRQRKMKGEKGGK